MRSTVKGVKEESDLLKVKISCQSQSLWFYVSGFGLDYNLDEFSAVSMLATDILSKEDEKKYCKH